MLPLKHDLFERNFTRNDVVMKNKNKAVETDCFLIEIEFM